MGRLLKWFNANVFGDPDEVLGILCEDSDGKINTSYVERLNLTIRNSLARFVRRTMNECGRKSKICVCQKSKIFEHKDPVMHSRAFGFCTGMI